MTWLVVLLFVVTAAAAQESGGKSTLTDQKRSQGQPTGGDAGLPGAQQPASDRLTRLAPEPVTILTESGKGSAAIMFVRKPGVDLPLSLRRTDAQGTSNLIPNSDITFSWQDDPSQKATTQRDILIANVSINTKVFIEPEINYKGSILLVWPDAEQRLDFIVVSRATIALEIYPEKTDVVLGPLQTESVKVRVKNTGKALISKLTISTLGFLDAFSHHQQNLDDSSSQPDIAPSEEREFVVTLPRINFAGTYVGNLDFVANGKVRRSMPLTIRQRGPLSIFGYFFWPFWPPILFLSVLLVGLFSSFALDSWFGLGGLQKAQASISLNETQTALETRLQDIQKWEQRHSGILLTNTSNRIRETLTELNLFSANLENTAPAKLASEGQRFAALAEKFNVFWAMLQSAETAFASNQERLREASLNLDRVSLGTGDVNIYRSNLLKAVEDTADDAEHGSMVTQAASDKAADKPLDRLRRKIKFMAYLQQSLVWLVVILFAYQMFYANNLAFGRLVDYIGLLLWTLGLTQTGSQIVARARTSPARTQPGN
jgi:hypothetical protein